MTAAEGSDQGVFCPPRRERVELRHSVSIFLLSLTTLPDLSLTNGLLLKH
jgi:hypothetical protein